MLVVFIDVTFIVACNKPITSDFNDSASLDSNLRVTKVDSSTVVSDCVFNSDYQGLTTDWLKELDKDQFVWMSDLNQAVLVDGPDSIFVSKGGCEHFATSVELRIKDNHHPITDSTFWIQKTLKLADEFQMTNYSKMIRSGAVRKVQDNPAKVWFEVDDDDGEDNLYYVGIEITVDLVTSKIAISQYYN